MTDPASSSLPPHDRLHGRRRGRRLRAAQQDLLGAALPRRRIALGDLGPAGPAALFPTRPEAVWLEIGFGGGEHLAWQAAAHPAVGLIGCEVFQGGIVSALRHLEEARLGNVELFVDDARLLLDALPDASIGRVFILFPDPWPKARHHKRRLISPRTMAALARILADGGELRLATDDVEYLRAMLAIACTHPDFDWTARRPADWRQRPPDWPETRYEAKAIAQGRPPAFLRLVRRGREPGGG
jgi:tRNA (guanine-N7-)-methyltransferase